MRSRILHSSPAATVLAVLMVVLLVAAPARGQEDGAPGERAGPDDRLFRPLLADPRQPRVAVALLTTDLFGPEGVPLERPDFGFDDPEAVRRELQALVALRAGTHLVAGSPRPGLRLSLGIEGGVFGRFRIESRTNDLVGTDWTVALPVEARWRDLRARLRFLHWSAHLGDEVVEQSGARRITYGYDAVDLVVSHRSGPGLRLYGGVTAELRSATALEGVEGDGRVGRGATLQAGLEVRRRPFDDSRTALVAAADWKRSHARRWRDQVALAAGVERQRDDSRVRVLLRAYGGPSQLGQFFLTDERILALELSLLR